MAKKTGYGRDIRRQKQIHITQGKRIKFRCGQELKSIVPKPAEGPPSRSPHHEKGGCRGLFHQASEAREGPDVSAGLEAEQGFAGRFRPAAAPGETVSGLIAGLRTFYPAAISGSFWAFSGGPGL